MEEIAYTDCVGFEWDAGNKNKHQEKHNVSQVECEQIFFNIPLLIHKDLKHSRTEKRVYALGVTDNSRALFVVFTIRKKMIRIISARDMSKKERDIYEKS